MTECGNSWVRLYIRLAAFLLITTGLLKILSAMGSAAILQTVDPVLQISFKSVFISAGIVEIGVGAICLLHKSTLLRSALIAWIATVFFFYRFCLAISGYHRPCPCLGNLTDALKIPPQAADTVLKVVLTYLLIGGYALLITSRRWVAKDRALRP